MASQAEVIRANQEAELARQVAATNFGAPEVEQIANGIPASGNDSVLAAHIKETRDKSVTASRMARPLQRIRRIKIQSRVA